VILLFSVTPVAGIMNMSHDTPTSISVDEMNKAVRRGKCDSKFA
jgi:hypothetical protein